ncbi:MAG: hypothetical protein KOO61_03140 [Spirochaetales bacterium]|nr:hypothetical protein [Spirochaetales bacterium]
MKRFLIAVSLLALSGFVVCADNIGENYEGGGVVYGGSGYLYLSLDGYWSASLDPWVSFLVADGFAAGVGIGAYTNSISEKTFRVSPSVSYAFGYDPDATAGPAHRVGLGTEYRIFIDEFGDSSSNGSLTPFYAFYYFVAPRIAPYVEITGVAIDYSSWGGVGVSAYLNVSFGMSFYLPNRDRVIGGAQK